jgi:hypothetical protein
MEITLLMLPTSGTNIFVAAIALYAAVNGAAATFKLHGRLKTALEISPIPLASTHFAAGANESVSLEREELPPVLGKVQAAATLRDKPHNYFVRQWRGELSLPISFWTNGVLLTVIAFIINRMVAARPEVPVTIQVFVPALVICFYVWSYVGIWRAAGRRTPAGADGWGWSARIATLLWIGFMVIIGFWAYFLGTVSPNLRGNAYQPATSLATNIRSGVDERGTHYLILDGPIVPGDPERFAEAIFEANSRGYRLDALRLNSPGGPVWEAMAMAVMVRWVENMATLVPKDGKCESSCFGILAAGYRKYVDPASDPTQIGVHSVYEIISHRGAGGAPVLFWKEKGDTTIWAVRRLKGLGVPDSIIGKIVTTPPDHMTYLTIEDLQQMGVGVTGHPTPAAATGSRWAEDSISLSPGIVRADISLNNGATIPRGTVVVTVSDTWEANALCFFPPTQDHPPDETPRMCDISYHLPDGEVSTARVREDFLILIKQGWNYAPMPSAQQPPQVQPLPQPPPPKGYQPDDETKPQPPSPSNTVRKTPGMYPPWPPLAPPPPPSAQTAVSLRVVQNLTLRARPDPYSEKVLDKIAKDSQVTVTDRCVVWEGSGRGAQDADNVWCPVAYCNYQGWANAYYLAAADGQRVACVRYPRAEGCPPPLYDSR